MVIELPTRKNKKQGKKQQKHGRNGTWCQAYRNRGQRGINRTKRIRRHLKKYPNDLQASEALKHA